MYKYVDHAGIHLQNCLLQVSRVWDKDKESGKNCYTCLVLNIPLLWVWVAVYDVL